MRKPLACVLWLMIALVPLLAEAPQPAAAGDKQPQQRSLSGQVTGHEDTPLPDAVVYLKNTKTLAVRTLITDQNGQYQFHGLTPNLDYEVFAKYKDKQSDTKTLSGYDSRAKATIHLRIDVAK